MEHLESNGPEVAVAKDDKMEKRKKSTSLSSGAISGGTGRGKSNKDIGRKGEEEQWY